MANSMATSHIYLVKRFGLYQEPVVVIDNFSSQPEKLIEIAKTANFNKDSKHYPGFRSDAYSGYLLENFELLMRIFENVYGIKNVMTVKESKYCLLTTEPKNLSFVQCYPQFHSLDKNAISAIHYFNDQEQGDLAFYRHRATGFEYVDHDRLKIYGQVRSTDFRQLGAIKERYMLRSNKQFDLIGRIPAKINRLVLFRSHTLHMDLPGSATVLRNDKNNGRLTINSQLIEKKTPHEEEEIKELAEESTEKKTGKKNKKQEAAKTKTFQM